MNDLMLLNLPLWVLHDGGVHRNNVLMWHMATCTVNYVMIDHRCTMEEASRCLDSQCTCIIGVVWYLNCVFRSTGA